MPTLVRAHKVVKRTKGCAEEPSLSTMTTARMPKQKPGPRVPELDSFPTRLKYARERAGLTQTALSELTGIDISQISRWERGERYEGLQLATAIRLARALGQPTGWLAADEGQPAVPVFREPTDRRRKPDRT